MKIEKKGYSSNPWRLIDSDGVEVWIPHVIDHPVSGMIRVDGPVCGETKKECTGKALNLLGLCLKELAKGHKK